MPKISISYRRADSQDITGRIFDRLVQHYGRESVFRDIDNIRPGIDFRKQISEALQTTSVLLVIVGPRWFGRTKGGEGRIDNEADPVRIEVETALRRDIPVIPILVGGATMPRTTQLPETVKDFAFRHAVTVDSGVDFDSHLGRLLRDLDRMFVDDQSNKSSPQDKGQAAASGPPASPAPAAEALAVAAAAPAAREAYKAVASAPAPTGEERPDRDAKRAPENAATARRHPRWVYACALLVFTGLLIAIIVNTFRSSETIAGVQANTIVAVLAVILAGCVVYLLAILVRKMVMTIRRRKHAPIESVKSYGAATAATGRRLPRWVYVVAGILLIVAILAPFLGLRADLFFWALVFLLFGCAIYLLATPARKLMIAVRQARLSARSHPETGDD